MSEEIRTVSRDRAWGAMGLVGLAAVGGLALAGCTQGESACESPTITLSSASVPAGGTVTVTVEGAYSACHDQGEGAAPPIDSVDLVLRSGG
ncbi:hypothetical protein KIN34_06865 [Cellulomonas sp. DKR-3]|uniref:Lipoprotein n=1 Tax=Cellulomonas fulva TaxID=2835530 RepID=A0ABS5TY05_9CELL|nr:hypothetical protein [Cellulomonas fulva]MBT0994006.1 hypothetical protein [Cellulomonas fulva]